jgi:hypothetical protein
MLLLEISTIQILVKLYLDRFSNCTMDPTSNSYIAKKIGTYNGEFPLRSKYVMLELSEEAPTDAVPAGFEGLTQRSYGSSKPPFLNFKTLYYGPNSLRYSPTILCIFWWRN